MLRFPRHAVRVCERLHFFLFYFYRVKILCPMWLWLSWTYHIYFSLTCPTTWSPSRVSCWLLLSPVVMSSTAYWKLYEGCESASISSANSVRAETRAADGAIIAPQFAPITEPRRSTQVNCERTKREKICGSNISVGISRRYQDLMHMTTIPPKSI